MAAPGSFFSCCSYCHSFFLLIFTVNIHFAKELKFGVSL